MLVVCETETLRDLESSEAVRRICPSFTPSSALVLSVRKEYRGAYGCNERVNDAAD